MPPFKSGLLKRKSSTQETKNTTSKDEIDGEGISSGDEELIRGELDGGEDSSDSEHEPDATADSDGEFDEVLFDDDVDSTLGDEEGALSGSDKSSDLTDSEEGDDSDSENEVEDEESDEEESENDDDDSEESVDSGAESGAGLTASSDEADKIQKKDKQKQIKPKVTDKKQKQQAALERAEKEKQTKEAGSHKSSVDLLSEKIKATNVNIKPVEEKDEYESGDTSDEEDRRNPAGDVPAWWYDEYQHVGYDLDGRRLMRPPQRDRIDDFLRKCEDPEFWRTVRDPATGQDVRLSAEDLQLIQRLRQGKLPSADRDEYEPWIEWFTREVLATPVRSFPEHKRSFLPSRSEQQQIAKIVHALKMGWTKTRKEIAMERRRQKEKKFYNLWGSSTDDHQRGIHKHIPAPRRPLPSHAESYNPPPEYLLDDKELKEWNKLSETPWKRKYTFLPTRHPSLRAVPAFARYTRERFLRCLDLYLAPRAIKMRLTISPSDLVPKLPSPRDLQPFPTAESLVLRGHTGLVRSAGFDPSGQYIVSGGDDGTVKVWETSTGRCLRTIPLSSASPPDPVVAVSWTPAKGLSLLAAAVGSRLLLVNPGAGVGDHEVARRTDELLQEPPPHKCANIITLLKETDPDDVPVFVAKDLHELPPVTFDHVDVTRLSKDITTLKSSLAQVQCRLDASGNVIVDERTTSCVKWDTVDDTEWARGVRLAVTHFKPVSHVSWHARGDYVLVTLRDAASRSVVVHQLSRRASQLPLRKARGLVQCAVFHPHKPIIFVATQRVVRVYDLLQQQLLRKLQTGAQWISALAVHPGGDSLLVASYDRKCLWFDLELSSRPYQTLRVHGRAVRGVAFHTRYPLFATAGDDPYLVVSHGQVFSDLLQNPLIVPLKQLPARGVQGGPSRGGGGAGGEGGEGTLHALGVAWHPTQPWLLSHFADGTLALYT